MTWLASMYTNPEVADIWRAGAEGRLDTPAEWNVYSMAVGADLREWENSYYQYEHGLFSGDEFEARVDRWRRSLEVPGYRRVWASQRGGFSPSFRAEIDRIVAEVEQAQ